MPASKGIGQAERLILDAKRELDAQSLTFYIRDPFWSDEFRLLLMPGVKVTEPMHGFMNSHNAARMIESGRPHVCFSYGASKDAPAAFQRASPHPLADANRLFGDFARREGVGACCMAVHPEDGPVQLILFANFDSSRDERRRIDRILALRDQLAPMHRLLQEDLARQSPQIAAQLIRILSPVSRLSSFPLETGSLSERTYFEAILRAALEAYQADPQLSFGTIHRLSRETGHFELLASVGDFETEKARSVSLDEGKGLVSWVAAKKKSIVVSDLPQSNFKNIYLPVRENMRSSLAVPLISEGKTLGVLTLESSQAAKFPPESVRTVWYAANQAAIAYRMSEQARLQRRLLGLLHHSVSTGSPALEALNELAQLAAHTLSANGCDLWQYDSKRKCFTDWGATSRTVGAPQRPRKGGWSDYILESRRKVWIDRIAGQEAFRRSFWDRGKKRWECTPQEPGEPEALATTRPKSSQSELGFPILIYDDCVGVGWLKYWDQHIEPPSAERMATVDGFAAGAGLVMDSLQHQKEIAQRASREAEAAIRRDFYQRLFPSSKITLPGLRVSVRSQPCGEIGGDFYAAVAIDSRASGILLGDARGHGIQGAFHMLPLLTTFHATYKGSRSAKRVMEQLYRVADNLGLGGSAIYLVVGNASVQEGDLVQSKRYLFACSAGHPPLIVVRGNIAEFFPKRESLAMGGVLGLPGAMPIGEDSFQVWAGDLIIACTDGILEAGEESCGEGMGGSRAAQLITDRRICEPEQAADAVFEAALKRSGGQLSDDATVLAVKVVDD